jgi:hypothetical protein
MNPTKKEFDKYSDYKVDFHGNDPITEENAERHRDKILDDICDDHPSAPMCKVFDD